MSEWKLTTLGDIAELRAGSVFPLALQGRTTGDYPFIKVSDMNLPINAICIRGANHWVDETDLRIIKARPIPKGATVFAKIGEAIKANRLRRIVRPTIIDNNMMGAIPKSRHVNDTFFYYSLSKFDFGEIASGSALPYLKTSALTELQILLPPLPEQRAIAHILGTLDDKIELGRRQSETLQEMARALFKAWFVDFEPVRAKMSGRWQRGQTLPGLPAHLWNLFPDRLVETEHGEVPQGWRLFTFGDVARQGKGTVTPGNLPGKTFTHYSIPAFDEGQIPVRELGEAIKSNKTPVPDNSLLLSKLNPHIPRVWLIGAAGSNAVCSTEFIVWIPKEPANSAFLYCLASSPEFNTTMRQLVTGTSNSHQRVKPEQLCGISIFAANSQAIQSFSEMVHPLMAQAIENRHQSNTIAALRDTLLPQLISGKLRVADAERFLAHFGAPGCSEVTET